MRIAAPRLAVALGAAVLLAGALAPGAPATAHTTQCKAELDTVAGLIEKADANSTADAAGKSAVRKAREHYKAAKKAHKAADDQTCIAELDAAAAALK